MKKKFKEGMDKDGLEILSLDFENCGVHTFLLTLTNVLLKLHDRIRVLEAKSDKKISVLEEEK